MSLTSDLMKAWQACSSGWRFEWWVLILIFQTASSTSPFFGLQITPSPSFPPQSSSVLWGQSKSFSSLPLHWTSSIIKSSETWPKCDSLVYCPPLNPSSLGNFFIVMVNCCEKNLDDYFGPKENEPANNLGDCFEISFRTIVTDRLPSNHDVPFPLIFSTNKLYMFWKKNRNACWYNPITTSIS